MKECRWTSTNLSAHGKPVQGRGNAGLDTWGGIKKVSKNTFGHVKDDTQLRMTCEVMV